MTGVPVGARRSLGAAIVVLAVLVIAGLNQWSGDAISGTPIAVWPKPPPVGSCVDIEGGFAVVPCKGPHDGEVTMAHDALDPIVTDTARDPIYDACDRAAASYLGRGAAGAPIAGTGGWRSLGPAYSTQPVNAPPAERAGVYGWQVCVIRPAPPVRYTGSVRHASASGTPGAYRTCWDVGGSAVSCTLPHTTEVLAIGAPGGPQLADQPAASQQPDPSTAPVSGGGSAGGADEQAQRAAQRAAALAQQLILAREQFAHQCVTAAARMIGVADPSYAGQLTVAVLPAAAGEQGDAALPVTDGQDCVIQAAEGAQLVGSVIGWGDRPPPLARG